MDKDFLENERKIDLSSIKKIDKTIVHILDKTDKVASYKFDGTAWHKLDVEGSLFVFSRSVSPYYGFIIQNRRSLSDNVCELLVDGMEFQRSNLYLLYKTNTLSAGDTGIRSIWFEDETGCLRISTLLNRLLRMRNESPTEASNNILKLFEKSAERVRESTSPTSHPPINVTCEKHHVSPKHKQRYHNGYSFSDHGNNRHGDHGNNYHSDKNRYGEPNNNPRNNHHNHPNNNRHHNEHSGKRHIDYGSQKSQTVEKQSTVESHGVPKTEKNLFKMFNQAHKRYQTKPAVVGAGHVTVDNKPVTIMKRAVSQQYSAPPVKDKKNITSPDVKVCKSKSSDMIDKLGCDGAADVKGIPITFQDLVNSVQQAKPTDRPLSCYSIGESSSSSVEDADIVVSGNEADQSSPTSYSGSDQLADNCITKSLKDKLSLNDSSKLLMSPLDFQKLAGIKPPPPRNPSPGSRTESGVSPVKRALFSNSDENEEFSKKSTFKNVKKSNMPDMKQFKEFLISAIQEDDDLVNVLYAAISKHSSSR